MKKPEEIPIIEYDYTLPAERIAKYPLQKRDESKLLVYASGEISKRKFQDAIDLLNSKDRLYFNTTKVVQARLKFKKETGANIEIFCLEPLSPSDHQLAFSSYKPVDFICLVGNAKKWKSGNLKLFTGTTTLSAVIVNKEAGKFVIRFSWDNPQISFAEILDEAGTTPIPPYLRREAEKNDASTYQTVYAQQDGSVAAPTAGLHFTEDMLNKLKKQGVQTNELILHVGAGTFIPVKDENAVMHKMHAEFVTVSKKMLESLPENGNVIAVGTTTTRSLESIYWLGVRALSKDDFSFDNLFLDQWDAYDLNDKITLEESIHHLLMLMEKQGLESFSFHTRIMISPGYSFKVIDGLFTNFHQPKSTLLLLIAALVGDDWKKIYDYALKNNFRFLSYGDSSLLF